MSSRCVPRFHIPSRASARDRNRPRPFILQLLSCHVLHPSNLIIQTGIFIRIVPPIEDELGQFIRGRKAVCRADHGVKSRKIGGPAGCPRRYAPHSGSKADWLDIENDSGRKLLCESLHRAPRLSGRIERTSTATAIIVDQLLATDLSCTGTTTLRHRLRLFIPHCADPRGEHGSTARYSIFEEESLKSETVSETIFNTAATFDHKG